MKDRFRILFTLLLPGALLVSCHPTQRTDAVLRDVESYINECPDSARVVLQSLDTTDLRTRQLRARYALLLTMALDKSYADVPDQVFDPAFRWYTRRGTPDERLKVWYYQGRRMVAHGNQNAAATAYSRAEAYVPEALDQHAVGLLYIAMQHLYSTVVNRTKEQEYAEKAYEVFKRADDPLTAPSLGILAGVYYVQKKWDRADSLYREAIRACEKLPSAARSYMSQYAQMKLLQPEKDPSGALTLLDRCRAMSGAFSPNEAGAYAYALALLGDSRGALGIADSLRSTDAGANRTQVLNWLQRIDCQLGDYASAYWEQTEAYQYESDAIQRTLEDSITQALRDDAYRQTAVARSRLRILLLLGAGIFFAMLSLVLSALMRKRSIEAERDRLISLRERMQDEMERHAEALTKAQEANAEQQQVIIGQEDRIREMEEHVAREREVYTRERVNRLRQLGELRSTFWWRERGGMRESDAIHRIKKEISYVFQTDNDGAALVRRLDTELDGAVSELRKRLHLRGKPQEVLFLCCCILDLEPELIAEIMGITKANVYEKRSRLRAKIRDLDDPLLSVLVEKK